MTATPETIEAAARTAESSLADRLRKFAEQEASLRNAIATLRIELGLPDRQPPSVVAILGSAQATLAEAEGKVNDGELTAAAQILEPLRDVILVKLQKFRAIWTADLEVALGRFGPWPEVPLLAAAVQQITSHITALDEKNDVKTFLLTSPDLQSDLMASLLRAAVPAVLTQARDIQTHLTDGREPKLVNELSDLQAAIGAAESARAAATSETLAPLAEKILRLRDAVVAALEAGNPRPAPGQPETPINGLADGKFATALQDVVTRRGSGVQREPGGEPGPGASVHMTPPPRLTESRVAIRSAWQISLERAERRRRRATRHSAGSCHRHLGRCAGTNASVLVCERRPGERRPGSARIRAAGSEGGDSGRAGRGRGGVRPAQDSPSALGGGSLRCACGFAGPRQANEMDGPQAHSCLRNHDCGHWLHAVSQRFQWRPGRFRGCVFLGVFNRHRRGQSSRAEHVPDEPVFAASRARAAG